MVRISTFVFVFLSIFTLHIQPTWAQNSKKTLKCSEYKQLIAIENLFIQYCTNGDTAKMASLIKNGVDVNCCDFLDDIFPLQKAVESYNLDAVKMLLNNGAKAVICEQRYNSWESRMDYLYHKPIKFDKIFDYNTDGQILDGKIKYIKTVIDLLFLKGYQIEKDIDESTLYRILEGKKSDAVLQFYDYLVSKGMKTNLNRYFKAEYFYGLINPDDATFYSEILKRGGNINFYVDREVLGGVEQTFYYDPPLIKAIKANSLFTVQWILKNGGDVNYFKSTAIGSRDKACSPLTYAIIMKNKVIVEILINAGADINKVCNTAWQYQKKSPLGLAMDLNATDIIDFLVSKGAK